MENKSATPDALQPRLRAEQLHTHYQQLPAMIIAPALGALFTTWVLWGAVNTTYLSFGLAGVLSISALRILLFQRYFAQDRRETATEKWHYLAISLALISGCIWGSMAIFLYPPLQPEYDVYMLVLLALVPVAPMAALAVYMPAFHAYYLPCITPFIITLGMQESRAERMTALLLLMMTGAIITFANRYAAMLTEAIRLRLQLADKTEQLEQAAIVKTRFLAAASHDLRQPVHAMGLFLESLQNRYRELRDSKLFTQVEQSILTLRRMLDAMLDISRLDADMVEIRRQNFRLDKLLNHLHNEYAPLATRKGLRFRYVASRQVVNSDPVLLERILRNFLSNAIKYTHHGRILLGCRRRGEQMLIQICDSGFGIPASRLDEVFFEFTRLHNAENHSEQGLGLGLSIIKRLAHLLEHEITVHSEEGRGSIFSIAVPCSQNIAESIHKNNAIHSAPAPELRQWRVLIVDDDEAVRLGMAALLEQWHAEVISAAGMNDLSDKISQLDCAPNLLLVDYHLSANICAQDVIHALQVEFGKQIPTIIITGDTEPTRIREAHEAGHILLHKPVDPEKLKACISSLVPANQVAGL